MTTKDSPERKNDHRAYGPCHWMTLTTQMFAWISGGNNIP